MHFNRPRHLQYFKYTLCDKIEMLYVWFFSPSLSVSFSNLLDARLWNRNFIFRKVMDTFFPFDSCLFLLLEKVEWLRLMSGFCFCLLTCISYWLSFVTFFLSWTKSFLYTKSTHLKPHKLYANMSWDWNSLRMLIAQYFYLNALA